MTARPKFFPMPTGHSGRGWHEIEAFIRCPKEYQLRTIRQVEPLGGSLSEPLSKGLIFHAMRAQWLWDGRTGDLWKEAGRRYKEQFEREEKKRLWNGALESCRRDFQGYVDWWSIRPTTKVLAIEYQLDPRKLHLNAPEWAKRTARLDSIERWMGQTWIADAKSTSNYEGRLSDKYVLHGQPLLALSLWGEEETRKFGKLAGFLIDPIYKATAKRTARGGNRITIPMGSVEYALKWFKRDFTTWVEQTRMIDWNTTVERKPNCVRSDHVCPYRDLCLRGGRAVGYKLDDGTPMHKWISDGVEVVAPWD